MGGLGNVAGGMTGSVSAGAAREEFEGKSKLKVIDRSGGGG